MLRVLAFIAVACGSGLAAASRNGTRPVVPQTRRHLGANSTAPPKRLFYVHVPKCGTSFQHAILQYACDFSTPDGLLLAWKKHQQGLTHDVDSHCPRLRQFQPGHIGMPLKAATDELVVIVRDPIERVASGMAASFHDCARLQKKFNCNEHSPAQCRAEAACRDPDAVLDYAGCVEGCASRMLTSDGHVCTAPTTWPNNRARNAKGTAVAISRIAEAAFVGVQDEWAMSTCVFVTKFRRRNGEPYDLDTLFQNTRPSTAPRCEVAAKAALLGKGYRDTDDDAVYREALRRLFQDAEAVAADPVYKACITQHSDMALTGR